MNIFEWDEQTPVTANNLNEMQNILNDNIDNAMIENYSTTEQIIGKWINDKPIYRRVYTINQFPNNTSIGISHGLQNFKVINIYGIAMNNNNTLFLNAQTGSSSGRIALTCSDTTLYVWANSDRSALYGYAILEYIKTTD